MKPSPRLRQQRLQPRRARLQQGSRPLHRTQGQPETVSALEYRHGWIGPAAAIVHLGLAGAYPLDALYHLINEHELPFGRLGNRYRFRRDHLDQWAERRGVAALAAVKAS